MAEAPASVAKTAAAETDTEYRAIEQTLLGTARGRWFLAEHGRRARRLDSTMLEEAMARLSTSMQEPPPVLALVRAQLEQLSASIAGAKEELLAKRAANAPAEGSDGAATAAASPAFAEGMSPTARMLRMAEDIHELTWTLQAEELSPKSCEAIARHASMLYAVSRQQAMESERTLKFTAILEDTTSRLAILLDTLIHEINAYGSEAPPPPADEARPASAPANQKNAASAKPAKDAEPVSAATPQRDKDEMRATG